MSQFLIKWFFNICETILYKHFSLLQLILLDNSFFEARLFEVWFSVMSLYNNCLQILPYVILCNNIAVVSIVIKHK